MLPWFRLVLSSMSFYFSFPPAFIAGELLLWPNMIWLISFAFWRYFHPQLLFFIFSCLVLEFFVSRRYFQFFCQFSACFILFAADFDVSSWSSGLLLYFVSIFDNNHPIIFNKESLFFNLSHIFLSIILKPTLKIKSLLCSLQLVELSK